MATKEKLVNNTIPIISVRPSQKPADDVFIEWRILFEKTVTPRKRNKIIREIITNNIATHKPKDKTITTSLKFQRFSSDINSDLCVLRVFRQFDSPAKSARTATKKTALHGLRWPVKLQDTIESAQEPVSDITPATVQSGPIRTPGPPVPKPPAGVLVISNTLLNKIDAPQDGPDALL